MTIDKNKYNQFINSIEIIDFIFPEGSWKLHNLPSKRGKIHNRIRFGLKKPQISPDRNQIVVRAELKIDGESGARKKKIFEISLTQDFSVAVNPELLDENLLNMYIERNAIFSIIANFREKIKTISFEMGLAPLILPALKMGIKKNVAQEKKENRAEKIVE